MANTHISTQEIARALLPRLESKLVFPNLCYRDYSNDFVRGKGDTVLAQLPYYFEAKDFTDGGTISVQDIKQKAVPVTLNKFKTVDVEWGSFEDAVSITDKKIEEVLEGMASAIAEAVNADGCKLYKDVPYAVGTAGTTPDGLDDFANARKMLNGNKAPMENRNGVWDVEADAKFTQLGNLVKVSESGSPAALREGEIGRVFGLNNYWTQAICTHTAGALTAGGTSATGVKVKSAITSKNKFVLISNASASATLTGSLKQGDKLTIGSNSIKVTVAKDATAADNEIEVEVFETVTLAANDAVTIGSNYTANLVFQQRAFAFVTRPLQAPTDKDAYTVSYNGLSIRVVKGYDIEKKQTILSADIIYGYKTCIPELACVVLG